MRVALVSPGYPPTPGGVETAVGCLARALVRAGCDVQVWTAGRHAAGVTEVRDGVRVTTLPSYGPAAYPVAPELWRHTVRAGGTVDVVHAHGFHATAALGVLPDRFPYVLSPHFHGVGHTRVARVLHRAYRPVGQRLLVRAARLIAASAAERELLAERLPDATERITVVHHGVDTTRLQRAEPLHDQPVLLVLGRLEPYKRVDDVVAAFARTTVPGRLVVVGDGSDRERLERLAVSTGRSGDIAFLGRLPDEQVARWLRTARGVVSMSQHEAFGLVALEGAAAGARVLLSDIPAHREVVGLAGGRARVVESHALAQAMDEALMSPPGTTLSLRSWDESAAEHLGVYELALRAQRTTTSS